MDKLLRTQLREGVRADKTTFKKDGTIEYRQFYFYRHGMTPEAFAEKVQRNLAAISVWNAQRGEPTFRVELVDSGDHWAPWPRDSYFYAIVRIKADRVIRTYDRDGGGVDDYVPWEHKTH